MEISLQLQRPSHCIVKRVPYHFHKERCSTRLNINMVTCSRVKDLRGKDEKTNFYELLSLSLEEKVGFEEIKKAYRSKALEFHPDVCPPSTRHESTQRFVELRRAYETLSDPNLRRMYDYELMRSDLAHVYEEDKTSFSRKVWERQLGGLKERSLDKMHKKKHGSN